VRTDHRRITLLAESVFLFLTHSDFLPSAPCSRHAPTRQSRTYLPSSRTGIGVLLLLVGPLGRAAALLPPLE